MFLAIILNVFVFIMVGLSAFAPEGTYYITLLDEATADANPGLVWMILLIPILWMCILVVGSIAWLGGS